MMDGLMIVFLIVVLIVGGLILFVIAHTRKSGAVLDVKRYRMKWLKIEQQLIKDEQASYQLAILNADKLLDEAMRQRGLKGATMGERMKSAQSLWSNANHVWTAHKIRNQIAHESDVSLNYNETRRALAAFKQALKDVGAI